MTWATLVLLAWGVLAFGGVRRWAYVPLFIGCGIVGALSMPGRSVWQGHRQILLPLLIALVAGVLQLIPLPGALLAVVSPGTDYVLRQYDLQYAGGSTVFHSISIAPANTFMAVAGFACSIALFAGTIALVERDGTRRLCACVLALGTLVALIGIIQKPIYNGRIYGLWLPPEQGNPFGPFVNRNHFAGWMLMAFPLSLGLVCGRVSSLIRRVERSGGRGSHWIATPAASQALLGGLAVSTMLVAVLLTLSRSGIAALLIGLLALVATVCYEFRGRTRLVIVALAAFVLIGALSMGSTDRVMHRFADSDWSGLGGRAAAIRDAWDVALRFMPVGSGLDTYGVAMLFFQTYQTHVHYAQAHSDYVELFAEGGLVVGLPVMVSIIAVGRTALRRLRQGATDIEAWWIQLGAATGLLSIAMQEFFDFSLQMPGNMVLLVVVAALAVHRPVKETVTGRDPRARSAPC